MSKQANDRGQIITFYSYKGGTGRTMALANIACLLAHSGESSNNENTRVLMVDWDLEAPGLHSFFVNKKTDASEDDSAATEILPPSNGLLELFEWIRQQYGEGNTIPSENATYEEALEFVNKIDLGPYITQTFVPGLKLIKAGKFNDSYAARVIEFDWRAFHRIMPWFFRAFAERLSTEFDYVLMDSRTGLTDVSGICTMLLPEKLVVVFTPNRQSMTGVSDLVRRSVRYRAQSDDLRPLVIYPLPSRIETSESELDRLWRYGNPERSARIEDKNDATQTGYQKLFEETFKEVYGLQECNLENYFNEIRIQHSPKYAYGEGLPVEEETAGSDRLSMKRSYESFQDYLCVVPAPWFDINVARIQGQIKLLLEKGRLSSGASNFEEAFDQLIEGIKLFESINGQEDPGLAEAIQDLAQKFRARGALEKAIYCLETALKIQERILGKENPKLIDKLSTLAELYQEKLAHEKAVAVALQALALAEKSFGSDPPKLVKHLQQISRFYKNLGNQKTAEEFDERAKRIGAPSQSEYPKQRYRVYLSSTARDLFAYREAVHQTISRLDGFYYAPMDDLDACDAQVDDLYRTEIADCDLVVLIAGLGYGSGPKGSKESYTQREYFAAREMGKPILVFLSAEGKFYDGYKREPDRLWKKQQAFRMLLNAENATADFATPDELAAKVATALSNWVRDHRETRPGTDMVLKAEVRGSGAIAQGGGAVAAGAGGVAIKGNVYGDVNVGVVRSDETAKTVLRNAYLNRILDRCGYLSLAGIDPAVASQGETDTQLSLNAVYTALLTRSPRQEEGRGDAKLRAPANEEKLRSALEQLDRNPRLVLQGDPGSGKSTFVNFVALCLAGEALGGERATNLARLTAPLPDETGNDAKELQPWRHGALLPVPVMLRDFAASGLPARGEATAETLWNFIARELTAACQAECAPWVRQELRERGGLLLLDGLDEVPEAEQRREQVKRAVEAFAQGFGNCRVLVTSRTYAYQNQGWRLKGFAEATLAPFSDGQIRRFVARWYELTARLGRLPQQDAAGRAELLKRAIFGRPTLYELAQRPLLLTLMASLHAWRSGDLPEKREALYAETVDLLLNRWEQRLVRRDEQGRYQCIQPSLAEYLNADKDQVRAVLEELAFEVHRCQPELIGTADLAEKDLVLRLFQISDNPDANLKRLVEYLRDRAGLLYPRGVGVYTFPHRSFQEYLAACRLTDEGYPDRIAELARAEPNRWREVALLAGAKAARGTAASLWQLVDALCFREPTDPAVEPADTWGAQIAAQALIETANLAKIGPANQRKLARVQQWLVKLMRDEHLPATERALAGDNLAVLGDPRFDAEHGYLPAEPLFGFIEIPAGSFKMGSDKRHDKQAYDGELPRHEVNLPGYYLARWPVTVAQFAAFVRDSGHEPADPNCLKGIANHPVVNVTWHEAMAYGHWLNEQLRKLARERLTTAKPLSESERRFWQGLADGSLGVGLPSEPEWEKAARGADGWIYPWGDPADPQKANYADTGLGGTSAVGCFPGGASPYGCEEMSGNVWEWTRSLWGKDWDKPAFGYPYDPADGRENLNAPDNVRRVLRGGAFYGDARYARCASRSHSSPVDRYDDDGFRVVVSPLVFSDR